MSDVFERVREAAARAAVGPLAGSLVRPAYLPLADESPFGPGAGREEYVARFRAELERLTGKVYGPLAAADAAKTVVEIAAANGAGEVLAWHESELPCPELGAALRRAGVALATGEVATHPDRQAELERLAAIPVGLTGAVAGLADTGSVVVASGSGRSRLASLLPPVHIAVLPVARIYPTMAAWLAAGGADLLRAAANVVVITGPSRTADIELTITLGVHGPKEIHVVLLE